MSEDFLKNYYKQHPEKVGQSLNQIRREMEELQMVLRDKERAENEEKLRKQQEEIAEARAKYDDEFKRRKESWLDDFKWFERHGLVTAEAIELATSKNGAVILTNLLKRGFAIDFVPPEFADIDAAMVKSGKKREYAPAPVSDSGEAFGDAVFRIIQSYGKNGQTVEVIRQNVVEDPAFKADLEVNTRRLTATLTGLVRTGKATKTDDGKYIAT